MYNKNGPNISSDEIVNIAPGEGQIPVSFYTEPDWEVLCQCLDWIEKNAVTSSIHFAERKRYQTDVKASQLKDCSNIRRMISDDQISSQFKEI